MSKFIELLKASIRRERQCQDALKTVDFSFSTFDTHAFPAPPAGPQPGFAATVPMQLGQH